MCACDAHKKAPLLRGSGLFLAVRLPRFVMRQDVFLRLAVQNVNIVVCQIYNPGPQAARINHHRGG